MKFQFTVVHWGLVVQTPNNQVDLVIRTRPLPSWLFKLLKNFSPYNQIHELKISQIWRKWCISFKLKGSYAFEGLIIRTVRKTRPHCIIKNNFTCKRSWTGPSFHKASSGGGVRAKGQVGGNRGAGEFSLKFYQQM